MHFLPEKKKSGVHFLLHSSLKQVELTGGTIHAFEISL